MFGLSKHEILINAIKNTCVNELPKYEAAIKTLIEKSNNPEIPQEKVSKSARYARCDYLNAVSDAIWNSFAVSSPSIHARYRLAMMSPRMTGLPEEFDLDYLCDNGISAGIVFALSYFAITNKTVSNTKMFKIMSMLNHYQTDLMNDILKKYSLM
jgi:hypothetical protein